jgi:hypothetical protein
MAGDKIAGPTRQDCPKKLAFGYVGSDWQLTGNN